MLWTSFSTSTVEKRCGSDYLISGDSGNQQKCSLRLLLLTGKNAGEGLASFHPRHPDPALSPGSRNTEHGPMGTDSETEDKCTLRVNAQNIWSSCQPDSVPCGCGKPKGTADTALQKLRTTGRFFAGIGLWKAIQVTLSPISVAPGRSNCP